MLEQVKFLDMFSAISQMIVARFALPRVPPMEYKDSMDTWQCWRINGWQSLWLVIALPNSDQPFREQFGCIGIVEEGFEEKISKDTTLQLMKRLFLFRVITLGDNCPTSRGRDIRVDCPDRDYGHDYIGANVPLEVIGGIMEMLAALRASDRSRPEQ
ncbi:TPA: hypothetical protein DIV45_01210 [Patescibacteria group bacterium]|nr:hypothetical protein [Patescibacteria group bacterium]